MGKILLHIFSSARPRGKLPHPVKVIYAGVSLKNSFFLIVTFFFIKKTENKRSTIDDNFRVNHIYKFEYDSIINSLQLY